jgi:hypothetical protein
MVPFAIAKFSLEVELAGYRRMIIMLPTDFILANTVPKPLISWPFSLH